MTRVPITSPLAVLTTRTTKEHLMTTHSSTDLKPGDIVQHPTRLLNGLVVHGDGESIRILHLTSLGVVTTTSDLDGWERVETVRPGHVQVRVNDLDLSRWEGVFEGGGWNHATRVAIRAANAITAQRAESTPPADEPEIVGDGCECWVTPEHMWTTYGSAVEPGSQVEYNPRCPKHGEKPTSATVTLFCPDCGGAENVTVVMLGKQSNGERWFDLREFHAHTCPPAQPDEPQEFGARIVVTDGLSVVDERWCRQHDGYWANEDSELMTWAYLCQRGTVTLGWDE